MSQQRHKHYHNGHGANNQRRNSQWSAEVRDEYRYVGVTEPSISEKGISIFRSPAINALGGVVLKFSELCDEFDIPNRRRGLGLEQPPAVNLLQLKEIKLNGKPFKNITAKEGLSRIYDNVESLRRKVNVGIERIAFFGGSKNPVRSVAITLDDDSRRMLTDERRNILAELEEMSDPFYTEPFDWLRSENPHISIGKIEADTPGDKTEQLFRSIGRMCPEVITLQPATMHNPNVIKNNPS